MEKNKIGVILSTSTTCSNSIYSCYSYIIIIIISQNRLNFIHSLIVLDNDLVFTRAYIWEKKEKRQPLGK